MSEAQYAVDTRAYCLRPDVVSTVMEKGAVLLDLTSKYFYSVNETGWFVVECLESGASKADILEICASCGMPESLAPSVEAFVDTLEGFGLLDSANDPLSSTDAAYSGDWEAPRVEQQPEPLQGIMASAFDPSLPLAE